MGFSFNSALTIPIVNAAGDGHVNSALTQTDVSSGTQTVTAGGNFVIDGDLQVKGTTTTVESTTVTLADKFLELGTPSDAEANIAAAANSGGLLIVDSTSGGSTGTNATKAFGGLRWNGLVNRFQWSADTVDGDGGTWNEFGAIDSVAAGAGITIDVTAPRAPKVAVEIEALGVATNQGGLALEGTGDAAVLAVADAGIGEGKLAITNTGTAGQVLTLANQTTNPNEFTWATPDTGFARKQSFTGTKALADAAVTIVAGSLAANNQLGQDVSVSVYEKTTNGLFSNTS